MRPAAVRLLAWIALAGAFAWFLGIVVWPNRSAPGYDLAPLAVAGRLVATGRAQHMYAHDPVHYNRTSDPVFDGTAREIGFSRAPTPFVHAPLLAFAMQPLAGARFPDVMRVWTMLSAAFLALAIALALRIYWPQRSGPWALAAALAALTVFEPIRYGFWLGQTTSGIVLLVLGALALSRRGLHVAAGVALALATFVKLTPGLLAAIWLWRGPRRAFAWFGAALFGLAATSLAWAGLDLHREYLARLRQIASTVMVAYNNHSLVAFLMRARLPEAETHRWTQHPAPPAATLAAWGLLLFLGGFTVVRLSKIPVAEDHRWRPLAEAVALALVLLVPSIAWTHYFVLLVPVLLVVTSRLPPAAALVAGTAFLLCSWPVLPDQTRFRPAAHQLVSGPTLAALLSAVLLVWAIEREARIG